MTTTTTTMTNDQQPMTVDDRRWATMLDTTMDDGWTFGRLTVGWSDGRQLMLGWSTVDDGQCSDGRRSDGRRLTLGWSTDNARMVGARIVDARRLDGRLSTVDAQMVDALMVDGRCPDG